MFISKRDIYNASNCILLVFVLITTVTSASITCISIRSIQDLRSDKSLSIKSADEITKLAEKILLLSTGGATLIRGFQEIYRARRKSAHEFLVGTILDKAIKIRDDLALSGIDMYGCVCQNNAITDGDKKYKIISFLNHLDYMCIAIENEIIDEDLAKDSAKYLIINSWKYFENAIKQFRVEKQSDNAWDKIENKYSSWKDSNPRPLLIPSIKSEDRDDRD
jgi:hypothetical protein